MRKSRFNEFQVVRILHEVDNGRATADVCWEYSISAATFYNWKRKFGGMSVSDLKRLRELEEENRKLKHMYATLSLGQQILKEIVEEKL